MENKTNDYLIKKYTDYYGDAYQLIDLRDYNYPYYRIGLTYIYKQISKIPKVEEYMLRIIGYGVDNSDDIKMFMGLDDLVFEDVFSNLHLNGYIKTTPKVHLTESGEAILENLIKEEYFQDEDRLFIDGITGKIYMSDFRKTKKRANNYLKPKIKYPRNENLNSYYRELYEALSKKIEERNKESKESEEQNELLEILEINNDETFKVLQKYIVLFYHNFNENEDRILVIKNGEPDSEVSNYIMEQEEMGNKIISFKEKKKNKEVKIDQQKIDTVSFISDINEFDKLKNGSSISTYSHPYLLKKALLESTSRIIINTPWIRQEVVDKNILQLMNKALKRDVSILIIYGMGNSKDIDKNTNKEFRKLSNKYKNQFKYVKINGDHAKVLICDERFMITTSFNWLSFKGDPNRGRRIEFGTYITDVEEINKTANTILSVEV